MITLNSHWSNSGDTSSMRQETVGKHVLHADSVYLDWRTKVIHIWLKTTGAKTTFTSGSDAGPLQWNSTLHAGGSVHIADITFSRVCRAGKPIFGIHHQYPHCSGCLALHPNRVRVRVSYRD